MRSDLLSGKETARQPYKIECQNVKGIAKRELLELTLFLRWIKCWEWVDEKGRVSEGQSILRILKNVFRDLVLWPYIYWTRLRGIIQLKQAIHFQGTMGAEPVVLFLRTDHWFNVKSGGSAGHLSGVIHGLRTLGYRTHVVSTDQLVGVEENGCFHLCEPAYELGRNIPNLSEILYNDRLLQFIEGHWAIWSPSFIYQRYSLGNYTGVLLKKKYKVPFICEYNGSFIWMSRHWGSRRLLHKKLINQIELLNLYGADLVVVVSQALKDELVARGTDIDKILVNPNGVDPDRYSPLVDGSAVRNRYHLDGKTVIGFIGTFGKWHGAEILAEAFGRFLQQFPVYQGQVKLFMIGDGVNVPLVKENLKKFDMEKSCILTGLIPQEKGPEYLAACDILVASHRPNPDGTPFFGSPTKLFEYMAMGKGIVASNLNQIGEVLKHDQTAIMVKPGDVESLMAGLKALIDDEERRMRLGQSARREVVAKYTWKMHTQKIIEKLKGHCR
jgi:glycosyltransferase involved in cell wall biosynthesis